jgi:Protein of unknown function (DUF3572)
MAVRNLIAVCPPSDLLSNLRFFTDRKQGSMVKPSSYSRESAEMLGVQALAFMAQDEDRLGGFIVSTGIAIQSLRDAAREPDFLAGVLEHMLADETLLIAFAESAGIDPAEVASARRILGKVWESDLP